MKIVVVLVFIVIALFGFSGAGSAFKNNGGNGKDVYIQTGFGYKKDKTDLVSTTSSVLEEDVLFFTNIERQKVGLLPLKISHVAQTVAKSKAGEMLAYNYFAHESPISGDVQQQFSKFGNVILGQDAFMIGENLYTVSFNFDFVAKGQEIVCAWMKSPGHKENLLKPEYTHIGVGYVRGENKAFAVQSFMAIND